MLTLTLALAVLLAQVFPLTSILFFMDVSMPSGRLPNLQTSVGWALNFFPALATSWWALRRLDVASFVDQLVVGRRWMMIGLILFAIYGFLAIGGYIASIVPYGSLAVVRALGLISFTSKAFLFTGLAIALCKELPLARELRGNPRGR